MNPRKAVLGARILMAGGTYSLAGAARVLGVEASALSFWVWEYIGVRTVDLVPGYRPLRPKRPEPMF